MGIVEGFTRGLQTGENINNSRFQRERLINQDQRQAENDRLTKLRYEKDSNYRDWQISEQKRLSANKADQNMLAGIEYSIQNGAGLSPEQSKWMMNTKNQQYFPPDIKKLLDPYERKAQAMAVDTLARRFSGENIPESELLSAGNIIYDGQLGAGKTIAGSYPSQDGQGLHFKLNVQLPDGTIEQHPKTKYSLTEADGDNEVKTVPISELVSDVKKRAMWIRALESARIGLGDMSPLKAQSAAVAAKAKSASAREQATFVNDLSTKKMQEEYRLKRGLLDAKAEVTHGSVKFDNPRYKEAMSQLNDMYFRKFSDSIRNLPPEQQDYMMTSVVDDVTGQVSMRKVFANMPQEMADQYDKDRRAVEFQLQESGAWPASAVTNATRPRSAGNAPLAQQFLQDTTTMSVDDAAKTILDKASSIPDEKDRSEFLMLARDVNPDAFVKINELTKSGQKEKSRGLLSQKRKQTFRENRDVTDRYSITSQIEELKRQSQNPLSNKKAINAKIKELQLRLDQTPPTTKTDISSFFPARERAMLKKRIARTTGAEKKRLKRLLAKLEKKHFSNVAKK